MLNCDTPPQPCDVSRAGQYANLLVSISELPSLEVDTVKTTHFWCGKVYDPGCWKDLQSSTARLKHACVYSTIQLLESTIEESRILATHSLEPPHEALRIVNAH